MKIIVGLGNPGVEYQGTRHNAGFMVLNKLALEKEIAPAGSRLEFKIEKKFNAEIAETRANGEKVILVKPQTFMNLSGESISLIMQYYKVGIESLIVVSDDVDLPLGYVRVRHQGSSGGHKGLQNIIDILGSNDFTRVRIGVSGDGNPYDEKSDAVGSKIETKDFVLSKFSDREKKLIDKVSNQIAEHLSKWVGKRNEPKATTIEIK